MLSSVGERMKKHWRHAEVSWAGQGRQFYFLIMLSYTNVMFKLNKYVNFSTCIDVEPYTLELLMKIIINPITPSLWKKYLRLQQLPRQNSHLFNSDCVVFVLQHRSEIVWASVRYLLELMFASERKEWHCKCPAQNSYITYCDVIYVIQSGVPRKWLGNLHSLKNHPPHECYNSKISINYLLFYIICVSSWRQFYYSLMYLVISL